MIDWRRLSYDRDYGRCEHEDDNGDRCEEDADWEAGTVRYPGQYGYFCDYHKKLICDEESR